MGPNGALRSASREVLNALASLPVSSQFQIIVFNSQARFLLRQWNDWLPADAAHQSAVAEALDSLVAEGRTVYRPALARALALAPHAIYFLTDGSDFQASDVQAAALMNRCRCTIHVIATNSQGTTHLQELARQHRGEFVIGP